MRRAPCAALLAGSLGLACAAAARLLGPSGDKPVWRELQSEHFVLRTDLRQGIHAAVLQELETLHRVPEQGMFEHPVAVPDQLEVVAFGSLGEFQKYTRKTDQLGYFSHDAFGRLRIVLGGWLGAIEGQAPTSWWSERRPCASSAPAPW